MLLFYFMSVVEIKTVLIFLRYLKTQLRMHSLSSFARMMVVGTMLMLSTGLVYAQDETLKFGKIDIKDLMKLKYENDTTAGAVVLGDKGQSYFQYDELNGFQIIFERHLRVKIFKKSGYDWANHTIPIYHRNENSEKITSLKAKTYNLENGKIVETKLENESIFEEVINNYWTNKKIAMPAIREGSIFEIKYAVSSPYFFNLRDWTFQSEIPVQYSEYLVKIPEYYTYTRHSSGYFSFTVNETTSNPASVSLTLTDRSTGARLLSTSSEQHVVTFIETTHRLVTTNVPAMKQEPFMTTINNYVTKIEYDFVAYQLPGQALHSYASTWKDVGETLMKDDDFGGQIKKSGLVKDEVEAINAKAAVPYDKMLLAFDLIKNSMTWNGKKAKYPTSTLRKALNDKSGNSADINLSLVLLLKELGLNARPVILSTRDNGIIIPDPPVLIRFNYVIAQVLIDDKSYLLDATDKKRSFGELPFFCLNGQGKIITEGGDAGWIDLLTNEKKNSAYEAKITVFPDGKLEGSLTLSATGYPGIEMRREYIEKGSEKYIRELKEKRKGWEVDKISFENMEDLTQPAKTVFSMSTTEVSQGDEKMIYFNVLANQGQLSNPFQAEERSFPVDFGCPIKETCMFVYTIPEGYTVESLPSPLRIALENQNGSFRFTTTVTGNQITITSLLSISKTLFIPSEYKALREFFARVVAKHSEQIILKKS